MYVCSSSLVLQIIMYENNLIQTYYALPTCGYLWLTFKECHERVGFLLHFHTLLSHITCFSFGQQTTW